jgi:cytochrome c peroxidase
MHNASIATLADVVRHYEGGGIDRPSRSPMLVPVQLTETERLDLVAFMETLTGQAVDENEGIAETERDAPAVSAIRITPLAG